MAIWNPKTFKKILNNKGQAASAIILTVLGLVTANLAENYQSPLDHQEQAQATTDEVSNVKETEETIQQAAAETETIVEEIYEPSLTILNLAYYFPEGADQSNVMESYAGQVYQDLTVKESEWIGSIYDLAETKPSAMASQLGKDASSVYGRYNPSDSGQDPDDPSTWVISDWKKVNISFYNGDGTPLRSYSNVKDILSMASVYTYMTDPMDTELFENYSEQLWEASHSYTVSMSDVYYCDGCLNKTEEELLAEQEEEELSVSANLSDSREIASETSKETEILERDSNTEETEQRQESLQSSGESEFHKEPDDLIGSTEAATNEEEEPIAKTIRKSTVDPTQWDHVGPGEEAIATPGNANSTEETNLAAEVSLEGAVEEGEDLSEASSEKPAAIEKSNQTTSVGNCPGHVDLNISIRVLRLDESKGLPTIDKIGNAAPANLEETETGEEETQRWSGWNEETLQAAREIAGQDWYQQYGLSISSIHMRDALSAEEIQEYMDGLPDGLSQERREIVQFALSSVGKIPYYWGGKASAPSYEGNSFGTLVESDVDGRILKGLDCSGWINWVYWSVTGEPLAGQSTSSLALCGRPIKREELQPGDIVLKTGTGAHVVMFLEWAENGQMLVIHESSTAVNNVTLKVMEADWPYYRNLLD